VVPAAVGHGLNQDWAVIGQGNPAGLLGGTVHGTRITTINTDGGYAIGRSSAGDPIACKSQHHQHATDTAQVRLSCFVSDLGHRSCNTAVVLQGGLCSITASHGSAASLASRCACGALQPCTRVKQTVAGDTRTLVLLICWGADCIAVVPAVRCMAATDNKHHGSITHSLSGGSRSAYALNKAVLESPHRKDRKAVPVIAVAAGQVLAGLCWYR